MNNRMWLAGIAACALLAPVCASAEDGKALAATLETGAAAINVQDDIKRVNEYSTLRDKNGVNPYGKIDLTYHKDGVVLDAESRFMDSIDQDHALSLDYKRMFRTEFSYSVMKHWLDHDNLSYLDAAIPPTSSYTGSAANPLPLTPDNVPAFWLYPVNGVGPSYGGSLTTPLPAGYRRQQIGRASVFGEDLTPDAVFSIKRKELVSKSDLTIPQLPNLTFHFKYRNEDRTGMEQSIGLSKCTSCHVTGQSRGVDENTRDITAGVTGRFGLLTLDYSFMNREFREHASAPVRIYDPALSPGAAAVGYDTTVQAFDNRLLYDYRNGPLRFDETPDSRKDSHVLKAKVDLAGDTTFLASYVNSTVKSGKSAEPGTFSFNGSNNTTLTSSYDSYGGRVSSRFGKKLSVTVQGRAERLRDDDVALSFNTLPLVDIASFGTAPNQFTPSAESLNPTRHSSVSRDTLTTGIEAMYRLAPRTTARLGYDYNLTDRKNEHLGETQTHTVKASINARPLRALSTRATVSFKAIDDPFSNPHAALTPSTDNSAFTVGAGDTYGIMLYDRRTADLSNQPDQVADGSLSATWSPSAHYSLSANYRVKAERNDLEVSNWSQTTHTPGLSVWYAPSSKVNLTFAYNYLNQGSETAFCQGWYDG